MARGTIALIGWLVLIAVLFVALIALILLFTGIAPPGDDNAPRGWLEVIWLSIFQTFNTNLYTGDFTRSPFLLISLLTTVGGIFVVGSLFAILTSGVQNRLADLRKGRSFVVERNHTVILGWSPQIFPIITELTVANENQPHQTIVVLADKDKVEMDDEIRSKVRKSRHTHIVTRSGNPLDLADLEIANPQAARSVIVLAPEGDDPDSIVIKTILALTNNPTRRADHYHIVAEIRDPKNLEVAKMVGRDEAQFVLVGELIARIAVQTLRQPGLSVVYAELLDFEGDEIYFQQEPKLVGKTFGEALLAYENSALIGLRHADGRVELNPPMETSIVSGDYVIAISEDDDSVRVSSLSDYGIEVSAIRTPSMHVRTPKRTLVLGWNAWAPTVVNELDEYVAAGSEVHIVADVRGLKDEVDEHCNHLSNQTVRCQEGDTTDRRVLDGLDVPGYHNVITLSYSDSLNAQQADARTLITLLHLRDLAEKTGHPFAIVSEMLDVRNRELAEVTRADDFIVSNRLVSLMLAQLSENKELGAVFDDLFDAEGSELYIRPAAEYVILGRELNFYTVVEAARRRGEVAVGYRLRAHASNPQKSYGVVINPEKSKRVSFSEADRIIVLAKE